VPAAGFGSGIERIIQAMIKQECNIPEGPRPTLFLIPMGEAASEYTFKLLHELRQQGISAQMDFTGRKIGKAMQMANQVRAEHVLVIGDQELISGMAELKEMDSGITQPIPLDSVVRVLRILEKSGPYIAYLEEMDEPFETDEDAQFFMRKVQRALEQTKSITEKFHKQLDELKHLIESEEE